MPSTERRSIWRQWGATGAAAAAAITGLAHTEAQAEPAADAPSRPNIVFVFTDDHAAQAVSAYGSKINETPNLDRLAAQGTLFENAFVANSICSPSRATLWTGVHSHINGVFTNREAFDGQQQTFPKILSEAGYETAMIGKWHLESEPTGFDYWEVLYGQGPYYNPPMRTPEGRVEHTGYTTDVITDLTIEWISERVESDKPFVVMSHHKAPHRNWKPGPDHLTLYDDVYIPEPPTLFSDHAGRGTAAKEQEMSIADHMDIYWDLKLDPHDDYWDEEASQWRERYRERLGRLTDEQREAWDAAYSPKNEAFLEADLRGRDLVRWKYQRYVKDYLRTIASVDDNVGRLMDYLEEEGLAENTVFVYSSDQGFFLGEHGWYDKRWIYEESLRIPLIVSWPGVTEPGSHNMDLVQNIDFAPTFITMAGLDPPENMQGRSLEPLLRGETPEDWRESIYYHYLEFPAVHMVNRHYGMRTDRYKITHFYELGEWEMYDLQRDPYELNSVYDDPFYEETREELKEELYALQEAYGDSDPQAPLEEQREAAEEIRAADYMMP